MPSMKAPKGTMDYDPAMLARLNRIISVIRQNALNLGAIEIQTPTMELTSLLLDKYGEEAETKLIYRLQKWGFEDLSLRYDLTVPLQRYIASNGLESIKRFQVGKVYRKDRPKPERGRFREFIQADLDIVGRDHQPMLPEAEIMKLITLSLKQLGLEEFEIRINFRDNLWEMVKKSGVTSESVFKQVCIAIDKLDKKSWEEVEEELREKCLLTGENIFILKELLDQNHQDPAISRDLNQLMIYAQIFEFADYLRFDATLARGLDYYTGLIYEVVRGVAPARSTSRPRRDVCVLTEPKNQAEAEKTTPAEEEDEPSSNPTLVAGGRYDKLIKSKRGYLPAIGVSFGVNRLEMVLRDRLESEESFPFRIFVVSQPEYQLEKLKIVNYLLNRGYRVEYYSGKRKNVKQINTAIKANYQYVLIYGEDDEKIKVKSNDQEPDQLTDLENLLPFLERDPFLPREGKKDG